MLIREVVPGDAAAIGKVVVDTWRSTYTGIVPQDFLDKLTYEGITGVWRERILTPGKLWPGWFIYVAADDSGKVFGFAGGGPSNSPELPFSGELGFIYLLKTFQRQGTGRRLMAKVASRMQKEGHRSMVLWVFTDNNSSRAFYEALGGRVAGTKIVNRYGGHLSETAYGWDNISTLVNILGANLKGRNNDTRKQKEGG